MVWGEKGIFDFFVGKDTRHRLEDRERMRARGMGMGMVMAPGDMPRRALAPTARPIHHPMMAQRPIIQCVCRAILDPLRQDHTPGCPLSPHYAQYAREQRRHLPRHRQRQLRGRHDMEWRDEYDDDDGFSDPELTDFDPLDDDDGGGGGYGFDDGFGTEPSILSDDRVSYDRHRPRHGRRGPHGRHDRPPLGRGFTALGIGRRPRDPRFEYPGTMGRRHGRGMHGRDPYMMYPYGMGGHYDPDMYGYSDSEDSW
ncbi:MAG: hypothetical protein Q9166_007592 [cf. Caloplaca sp. 2 TL-2023]